MSRQYSHRCHGTKVIECEIKSFHKCEGTSQRMCYHDLPTAPECQVQGSYQSKISGIGYITQYKNNNDLSDEERMFTCVSAQIQEQFTALNRDSQGRYTSAFIGSSSGAFRSSPRRYISQQSESCKGFDPRMRPWYAAGISSAKNIIILLPITKTVRDQGNQQLVKTSGKVILQTFSANDFFNIIVYGNGGARLLDPSINNLIRANSTILKSYLQKLEGLSQSSGDANYEQALTLGFEVLSRTNDNNLGAPCSETENIFLMFSDGPPQQGLTTFQEIRDKIHIQKQDLKHFTMFTYALPSQSESSFAPILLDLSCDSGGIFFSFSQHNINPSNPSEVIDLIISYYQYLAEGAEVDTAVWTAPYNDFFGFGRMTTVAFPIYSHNFLQERRKILGVAGIDVLVSFIASKFGLNDQFEIQQEVQSLLECSNNNIFRKKPCNLERLRPERSKCSPRGFLKYANCPIVNDQEDNCKVEIKNIFRTAVDTTPGICCPKLQYGQIPAPIPPPESDSSQNSSNNDQSANKNQESDIGGSKEGRQIQVKESSNQGTIIIGVVCGILGLIVLTLLCCLIYRYLKRKKLSKQMEGTKGDQLMESPTPFTRTRNSMYPQGEAKKFAGPAITLSQAKDLIDSRLNQRIDLTSHAPNFDITEVRANNISKNIAERKKKQKQQVIQKFKRQQFYQEANQDQLRFTNNQMPKFKRQKRPELRISQQGPKIQEIVSKGQLWFSDRINYKEGDINKLKQAKEKMRKQLKCRESVSEEVLNHDTDAKETNDMKEFKGNNDTKENKSKQIKLKEGQYKDVSFAQSENESCRKGNKTMNKIKANKERQADEPQNNKDLRQQLVDQQ